MNSSALERRLNELATLNAIGEILNREADFKVAIGQALERLVELLGLSTGWVFLTRVAQGDSHHGGFSVAAATGLPPALAWDCQAPLHEGGCDCQWLFRRGRLDTGVNIVHCSRLEAATEDKGGLEIHASVPLLGQGGPVGIINLAAPGREHFDQETLTFLTAVGRQLGTAFERWRFQEERTREARYLATLEERQRLAGEMHDSVAQLLFAADLSLRAAQESAQEEGRTRSLEKASELVSGALGELRALVEVLRPADLSHGLRGALARLAQRTTGEVRVHLEADEVTLEDKRAEGLYRVAQEALHNALRHADAKNVWLRLGRAGNMIFLRVEDDGKGLDEGAPHGLGLNNMRARAEALGGTLSLRSRREGGLTVEVEVPWRDS